jgi:serine/threonine-protein kinase/endoribonuclease IRE1
MDAKFALANIPADAADLISSMIDNDPAKRPDAAAVLEHSFFWGPDKKLQFLCDASNFFEFEKPTAQIVLDLEHDQNKQDVIPGMAVSSPQ